MHDAFCEYSRPSTPQDLKPDDVHWTLADSGWAKSAWGCLFPQWLLGVTVVQYRQGKKYAIVYFLFCT